MLSNAFSKLFHPNRSRTVNDINKKKKKKSNFNAYASKVSSKMTCREKRIFMHFYNCNGCMWQGQPLWGWGCCALDTASSSWLQWTHCRAKLSPSAAVVVPGGKRLRKGKNAVQLCERKRSEEKSVRNSPAVRAGAPCAEERSPAAPGGGKHCTAGISLQPVDRTMPERISTLQPVEDPHTAAAGVFWRTAAMERSHAGAGEKFGAGVAELKCYKLTATPHPPAPVFLVLSLFLTIQLYF